MISIQKIDLYLKELETQEPIKDSDLIKDVSNFFKNIITEIEILNEDNISDLVRYLRKIIRLEPIEKEDFTWLLNLFNSTEFDNLFSNELDKVYDNYKYYFDKHYYWFMVKNQMNICWKIRSRMLVSLFKWIENLPKFRYWWFNYIEIWWKYFIDLWQTISWNIIDWEFHHLNIEDWKINDLRWITKLILVVDFLIWEKYWYDSGTNTFFDYE